MTTQPSCRPRPPPRSSSSEDAWAARRRRFAWRRRSALGLVLRVALIVRAVAVGFVGVVGANRFRTLRAGGVGVLAACEHLPASELLEEIVEQVAHQSGESSGSEGRWSRTTRGTDAVRAREALDGPAERGEHGLGELVRTHRRGAGRLEPEGRPDGERRTPRPRRILGRHQAAHPQLEPAGVLEDQATQGACEGRAEAGERWVGGGPAAGATSRNGMTPSSSTTHRRVSHQPSGASDGRAIPARYVRSPMRTSCSRRNDGPGGGSRSGTDEG